MDAISPLLEVPSSSDALNGYCIPDSFDEEEATTDEAPPADCDAVVDESETAASASSRNSYYNKWDPANLPGPYFMGYSGGPVRYRYGLPFLATLR
jgi:hypothetical protein